MTITEPGYPQQHPHQHHYEGYHQQQVLNASTYGTNRSSTSMGPQQPQKFKVIKMAPLLNNYMSKVPKKKVAAHNPFRVGKKNKLSIIGE